jgi:hypothetical protein
MAGLCYDTQQVETVTIPVDMPDKTPCALPHDFIRKNFLINPLEGGLCGTFSIYRHFSRKKVRLSWSEHLSEYQAEYPAILDIATSLSLNKLLY